jgi:hypothetical protein
VSNGKTRHGIGICSTLVDARRDIPVATMTLARDAQQERTLLAALQSLARVARGTIFAADGGSPREFVDALGSVPVRTVDADEPNLVGQVRASLRAAAGMGAPFLLYTEPDKQTFFDTHLDAFLASAPLDDRVGIVLAARSSNALTTFPAFQQRTERTFNELCAEIVGERADYLYGPFIVKAALVGELAVLDPAVGWGWRPFLFAVARRRGYRIAAVTGDFDCPTEQRGHEERVHRMKQLSQNVDGLARACV